MLARRFADLDIQELLGIGGAAEVYRAIDRSHGEVAVKVLSANAEPEMVERFLREGHTMSAMQHPHIVQVHRLGEQDGSRYIVMELAGGGSLRDLLVREPLPWRRAVQIAIQLTQALQYAHQQGIYHRDVKPGNVMFTADGQAKLMDFGLAHVIDAPSMTRTGTVMGTVLYLSPEQAVGKHVDQRSDLYALGAVLFEMISGQPPFTGPSAMAVIYKHLNEEPPRLRDLVDVPPQLDAIVARLLKKDVARRYQQAADLIAALEMLLHSDEETLETLAPIDESSTEIAPFVGREAELTTLQEQVERAASGLGGTIMVAGEAGIGKSRLLQELAGRARTQNVVTLSGACLYADAPNPYAPIVEILDAHIVRHRAVRHDADDPLEREIAAALADVQEALGITPLPADGVAGRPAWRGQGSPLDAQRQTFELLVRFFAAAARQRPLILVLDDLQWASPTLLQLLHHLARGLRASRVLLIGAYRPEDLQQPDDTPSHPLTETMRRMRREQLFSDLRLEPLPIAETHQLLIETLHASGVSDEMLELMQRESEGNPFYIIETLRLLQDQGGICSQDDRWTLDASIERAALPQSLTDLIMRRVDRVPADERELLDWGAILGQRLDTAVLSALLGGSRLTLLRRLQSIEQAHHLLTSDSIGFGFAHNKIRQALYDDMPVPLRAECHVIAAETIEGLGGIESDPQRAYQLAHHYVKGGARIKGYRYSLQAARQSEAVYALAEARALYQQALDLLTSPGEPVVAAEDIPAEELGLRMRHGQLLLTTGEIAASQPELRRALELARSLAAGDSEADLLLDLGVANGRLGEWDKALAFADHSLRIALDGHDDGRAASALLRSGFMAFEQGDWQDAIARLKHGLELARRQGDRLLQARLLGNMAIVHHVRGKLATAIQLHQANIPTLEELGSPMDIGRGYSNLGFSRQRNGDLDEAESAYRAALTAFQKVGEVREQGVTYLHLAEVALLREELALAREHCGRAIDRFERVGFTLGIADVHRVYAGIARQEARWSVAERYLQEALAVYSTAGDDLNVAETEEELGHLMEQMGEGQRAREALERSRTMFDILRGEEAESES